MTQTQQNAGPKRDAHREYCCAANIRGNHWEDSGRIFTALNGVGSTLGILEFDDGGTLSSVHLPCSSGCRKLWRRCPIRRPARHRISWPFVDYVLTARQVIAAELPTP